MSPHPPSPHAIHVSDPETRAAVERRLLARGVPRPQVEDETQNVLRELFEAKVRPATRDECIALARHIANQRAIDHVRKRTRRGKYDVGPTDVADDHPLDEHGSPGRDPIDLRKQVDLLKQQIESGLISRRQASIMVGVADGLDQSEIARQMKLSHQTVRNELSLARKTYRSAWSRIAGSAALLLLAVFGYSLWREREGVESPPPRPPKEHLPRAPGAKERGAEVRRDALHECDLGHWAACLKGLDQARDLDPDGDRTPNVQKARGNAEKALGVELRP